MFSPAATSNGPATTTRKRGILRPSRQMLAIIALVVVVAGFLTAAYTFHLFTPATNCWARPTGPAGTAIFTVVMANEGQNVGYNGSLNHNPPWPVMNVTLGQNIIIHVINNDTQVHGFQITHYFDAGINGVSGLAPGSCYNVDFTANVLGSFKVQCNIFCTIHYAMLSGQLNVNQ